MGKTSNTHRAYVKCYHEDCMDGGKDHLIAGGSESYCKQAANKQIEQGREAYVRPITEQELR